VIDRTRRSSNDAIARCDVFGNRCTSSHDGARADLEPWQDVGPRTYHHVGADLNQPGQVSPRTDVDAVTQPTLVIDCGSRVDDASVAEHGVHGDDSVGKDLGAAAEARRVRDERGSMLRNDGLQASALKVFLNAHALVSAAAADGDEAADVADVFLAIDPSGEPFRPVEKGHLRPWAGHRSVVLKERDERRTAAQESLPKDSRLTRRPPEYDSLDHGWLWHRVQNVNVYRSSNKIPALAPLPSTEEPES
jgi:hypothetical protein